MSPRALLALLALSAASSAVAVARPEATPVGSTPGTTPLGDAVRRDEAVVLASSMTAVHEEDLGWYGGEDASRSWYVRCHALASPGETRLAGTLPVVRPAAKRAVVPLGFALGTVSPANDTVLACALFDLLPGVSRARVSRAVLPLARFADAADAAAVLSFPRGGSGSHAWVSLELRCDACVKERVFVSASSKKKKKKKRAGWRDAFFAAAAILVAGTCALVALAVARCRGDAHAADASRRLRVKRKTSDAPGGGGPAVRASSLFEETNERERARREARRFFFGQNALEAFV